MRCSVLRQGTLHVQVTEILKTNSQTATFVFGKKHTETTALQEAFEIAIAIAIAKMSCIACRGVAGAQDKHNAPDSESGAEKAQKCCKYFFQ